LYRIGWFSTGRDRAARELLTAVHEAIARGDIRVRLEFVFCNREPGEADESDRFIELARSYGAPVVCLSSKTFLPQVRGESRQRRRLEYDRQVMRRLEEFTPDLCVLAGYMLIVGEEMCTRLDMVNLHPALPGGPAGTWQEVIWQLIEQGADRTGAMMHLVTPELDKGPPVTFCSFPIRGGPFDRLWKEVEGLPVNEIRRRQGEGNSLLQLIRRYGVAREIPLVVSTVRAFSEGHVRIDRGQVLGADGTRIEGYDLTDDIEAALGRTR